MEAGKWAQEVLAEEAAPFNGPLMYLDRIVFRHGRLPLLEFDLKVKCPAQGDGLLQQQSTERLGCE